VRIALITEIPSPFRIPLWNSLAAQPEVELLVVLLSERDPRRNYELHRDEWRFDVRTLPGRETLIGGRWLVFSRGVGRELDSFRPDLLVIGGWNQPAFLQAANYARRHRIPYVVWVESTARDTRPRRLGLAGLKRRFLASAGGVLVPGSAAAAYVESLGVERERIAVARNAFDLERFSSAVDTARSQRDELRRELGISGCCFLSVTRLSPEKGVDVLVRAFQGVPAELIVVGDGNQERELRRLAPSNVRLVGRVGRDQLPRWYAAADAFALASRSETWGMVLSEAAVAGLPIVASEAAGAAWDLVEEGVNGFRVPVADESRLRKALTSVATDEEFRSRAGARSRELAERATPDAWAADAARLAERLLA
jgi:glycosyltransferase involved in cell wall biosynthesis